jgi:hypothetical protein
MICLFVFPLPLLLGHWAITADNTTQRDNLTKTTICNKKQLAEEMSHQVVAYHVILELAMPQQAEETISIDSHPSPLSNLAEAKPKETDED